METSSTGIFGMFAAGGTWMYFIFLVQAASIVIIADRINALFFKRRPTSDMIINDIENSIKRGQLENVIQKGHQLGVSNPIGTVAAAGAQAAIDLGGREEIQGRMDEVLLEENRRLQSRTIYLAMLGNVATLLGLLGTIVGMIGSFSGIATADPIQKANILAKGISEAMNCTAYGLITAIPALVMFTVLQNRSQSLFEDLNHGALKIFNALTSHFETSVIEKKAR